MIEVQGVSKAYSNTKVVDSVSLNLPRGGITAIIGPNGAGKSTLLSMIARLTAPDAGRVLVDGLDVAHAPSDLLAKKLAILRQDNHLTARLTVEELVGFGRYPHSKGRLNSDDRQHIAQAIAYLDLHDYRQRFLDQLSGGQRQRAFVAMVLAQDTDYVLLDEPLNNLDMQHATSMMKLLHGAAANLGKTIVMVLHDINFAALYASHIVAMRQGRLCFSGAPQDLMTQQTLQQIYQMDIPICTFAGHRFGLYYL